MLEERWFYLFPNWVVEAVVQVVTSCQEIYRSPAYDFTRRGLTRIPNFGRFSGRTVYVGPILPNTFVSYWLASRVDCLR